VLFFFEPSDPMNLSETLSKVVDDRSLRDTMSRQGLKFVEPYSPKKMLLEYIDLYERVSSYGNGVTS